LFLTVPNFAQKTFCRNDYFVIKNKLNLTFQALKSLALELLGAFFLFRLLRFLFDVLLFGQGPHALPVPAGVGAGAKSEALQAPWNSSCDKA
jgi:hypothetical protein